MEASRGLRGTIGPSSVIGDADLEDLGVVYLAASHANEQPLRLHGDIEYALPQLNSPQRQAVRDSVAVVSNQQDWGLSWKAIEEIKTPFDQIDSKAIDFAGIVSLNRWLIGTVRLKALDESESFSIPDSPAQEKSTFDGCIRKLEARHPVVSERIKFLGCAENDGNKMSEGSLKNLTGFLCDRNWNPPTSIALDDEGLISATWRDAPWGSATMLFPGDQDGLFQLTAMYGDANSDEKWIQVVGNLGRRDAAGQFELIQGFCR